MVQIPKLLSHITQVICISVLHVLTQCLMISDSIKRNATTFRDYYHHFTEITSNLDLKGHNDLKSDKNLKKLFMYKKIYLLKM